MSFRQCLAALADVLLRGHEDQHVAIKSGEKKDMGSFFRPLTDEEREIFMEMVQDSQDRFLDVVDEGRSGLTRDELAPLADGRIFTATQAKDAKLIDDIGYLEDAFEAVKKEAGLKDAALVVYSYRTGGAPNIYTPTATAPSVTRMGSVEEQLLRYLRSMANKGQPSLLCLWEPGLLRLLTE